MKYGLLGALLVSVGIAARIVAPEHRPVFFTREPGVIYADGTRFGHIAGWSRPVYDAVRIGGWTLIVFGALIAALAVVREARTVR